MTAQPTFASFELPDDVVQGLTEAGMHSAFPIQAMTLPVALSGHDIIGQAKTGTGKTLGFALPVLARVARPGSPESAQRSHPKHPQAIIITPTRELAIQVATEVEMAGKRTGVRVVQIYGGRPMEPQIAALKKGCEVIVGTPGRVLDLNQQGHLHLSSIGALVLDEADEMLDLGFLPDIERILALTPASRQTMLFSATMPGPVVALARRYMNQPTHIRAVSEDDTSETVAAIEHFVYRAHPMDKTELVARALQAEGRGLTIIFTTTKRTAAKLSDDLVDRGFAAAAIHGDLGQGAREQALRAFRKEKVDILVATDVAARGIDVDNVTHVINYQCPDDDKTFVHRTGRTGRAGNTGVAITLVDWDEIHRWALINKALGLGIPEPVETYSSSEHLFTDLTIKSEVTGSLPKSQRVRAGLDAEEQEDLDGPSSRRKGRGARSQRGSSRSRSERGGSDRPRSPRANREQAETKPRRNRQRRRLRGGEAVEGKQLPTRDASAGKDSSDEQASHPSRTRRRARRSSAPKTASDEVAQSMPPGNTTAEGQETVAPPRRRRSSSSSSEDSTAQAPVAKKSRARRTAAGPAADAPAPDAATKAQAQPADPFQPHFSAPGATEAPGEAAAAPSGGSQRRRRRS